MRKKKSRLTKTNNLEELLHYLRRIAPTGGHNHMEKVAAFAWIRWPDSRVIDGQNQ